MSVSPGNGLCNYFIAVFAHASCIEAAINHGSLYYNIYIYILYNIYNILLLLNMNSFGFPLAGPGHILISRIMHT